MRILPDLRPLFLGAGVVTFTSDLESSSMVGSSRTWVALMQLATFTWTSSAMLVMASWSVCLTTHCHSPGVGSACVSGGTCKGWALWSLLPFCHLLGTQLVYKPLVGGQPWTYIHQQVHYSCETWLTIFRIRLPHMVGGELRWRLFPLGWLLAPPSGAEPFLDLGLEAILEVRWKREKSYCRCELIHLKMLSGRNF